MKRKKKEASFAVLLASACMLACWTVTMARCASPWCTWILVALLHSANLEELSPLRGSVLQRHAPHSPQSLSLWFRWGTYVPHCGAGCCWSLWESKCIPILARVRCREGTGCRSKRLQDSGEAWAQGTDCNSSHTPRWIEAAQELSMHEIFKLGSVLARYWPCAKSTVWVQRHGINVCSALWILETLWANACIASDLRDEQEWFGGSTISYSNVLAYRRRPQSEEASTLDFECPRRSGPGHPCLDSKRQEWNPAQEEWDGFALCWSHMEQSFHVCVYASQILQEVPSGSRQLGRSVCWWHADDASWWSHQSRRTNHDSLLPPGHEGWPPGPSPHGLDGAHFLELPEGQQLQDCVQRCVLDVFGWSGVRSC